MSHTAIVRLSALFLALGLTLCLSSVRAQAQTEPVGPYQQTCKKIHIDSSGRITAVCQNFFYAQVGASLANSRNCPKQVMQGFHGQVWNVDGVLRCVLFEYPSPSGRDIFDIISMPSDTKTDAGETKVWRIDHPNVVNPQTGYGTIPLNPGDFVKIKAGGCVQTGGSGLTWKNYVDPDPVYSGVYANPSPNYYGKLNIPGVTQESDGQLQPIANILVAQPPSGYQVPTGSSGPDRIKHYLQLGYQDDAYGDNGYYSHDNGTNNQCADLGPAYVELAVTTPKIVNTGPQLSYYLPGEQFDVVWNINGADDNGLPMNPVWSYQVQHPRQKPDFVPNCTYGFSLSLNSGTCTSQAVGLDLNSGVDTLLSATNIRQYCGGTDTALAGHANWYIVTYQGNLHWRDWSGHWPQDDDLNFGLDTLANAGETVDSDSNFPGIGVEFNKSETTDNFGTPFWQNLGQQAACCEAVGIFSTGSFEGNRYNNNPPAVITALLGIDGVHGGYSELHPVFAMAIETAESSTSDGMDQTWDFFIRTEGNEGGCASNAHDWPSLIGNNIYSIQLPWPDSATNATPTITAEQMYAPPMVGFKFLGMEVENRYSFLRFQLPPSSQSGIDGQLTIHYSLDPHSQKKALPRNREISREAAVRGPESSEESEFGIDWAKLSARIQSPAMRRQFMNAVNNAMKGKNVVYPKHTARLPDNRQVTEHHPDHDFGAWKGKGTRGSATPDREKLREIAAIKVVLGQYASQLGIVPQSRGGSTGSGGGIQSGPMCPGTSKFNYQTEKCTNANGTDAYDQGPRQNIGLPPNPQ